MVNDAVLKVMVLGEIGVGKSSVINLIVGGNVAKVSPNAEVCTRRTTKYEATVESMKVHILSKNWVLCLKPKLASTLSYFACGEKS